MRPSASFIAFVLCVQHSIASQNDMDTPEPVAAVTIKSRAEGQKDTHNVLNDECTDYKFANTPIDTISISVFEDIDPICTFYAGERCSGKHYSMKKGDHGFDVNSFRCSSGK